MQSYFLGVEGNPAPNMRVEAVFNFIGRVAQNPIDEIFYENRARNVSVVTDQGTVDLEDVNRLNVYQAEFEWNAKDFDRSDCQWLKVFIYTAEDDCGNVSEPVKINYEGLDEEAPQPTGQCDNEVMTIGTEMGADCPQDASISLQVGDEISADDNSWTVAGIPVADMNGTLVPCFTDNCADVSELTFRVIDKGEDKTDCSTILTVTFEVEDRSRF